MGGNNADEFKTIILVANDYQIVNIYSVPHMGQTYTKWLHTVVHLILTKPLLSLVSPFCHTSLVIELHSRGIWWTQNFHLFLLTPEPLPTVSHHLWLESSKKIMEMKTRWHSGLCRIVMVAYICPGGVAWRPEKERERRHDVDVLEPSVS